MEYASVHRCHKKTHYSLLCCMWRRLRILVPYTEPLFHCRIGTAQGDITITHNTEPLFHCSTGAGQRDLSRRHTKEDKILELLSRQSCSSSVGQQVTWCRSSVRESLEGVCVCVCSYLAFYKITSSAYRRLYNGSSRVLLLWSSWSSWWPRSDLTLVAVRFHNILITLFQNKLHSVFKFWNVAHFKLGTIS